LSANGRSAAVGVAALSNLFREAHEAVAIDARPEH
jgi:hypothetical protein